MSARKSPATYGRIPSSMRPDYHHPTAPTAPRLISQTVPMAAITPETLHAVAAQLGLEVDRFEETRPADAESIGNGNWFAWNGDHRHVLRRYHVLRTAEDLAYESAVLRHLTARGWSVPAPVAGPVRYDGRLWAATRHVPGAPHRNETAAQIDERGTLLAKLHADLADLDLGQRQGFFQGSDLDGMGTFQDWDPGLQALRELRPDLADWAAFAMAEAKKSVAENNLLELPQTIVHGDFATWNLHFTDGRLSGVIDFDLTHQDSRSWEFMIARVYRAPELIDGYQRAAKELGNSLTEAELAAIPLMHGVFRVNMVMAELWSGPRTGSFDLPMIERQLGLTGSRRP
jgi:Ser/Thr protein kinase RdoA (MazF antagonist)